MTRTLKNDHGTHAPPARAPVHAHRDPHRPFVVVLIVSFLATALGRTRTSARRSASQRSANAIAAAVEQFAAVRVPPAARARRGDRQRRRPSTAPPFRRDPNRRPAQRDHRRQLRLRTHRGRGTVARSGELGLPASPSGGAQRRSRTPVSGGLGHRRGVGRPALLALRAGVLPRGRPGTPRGRHRGRGDVQTARRRRIRRRRVPRGRGPGSRSLGATR